MKRYDSYKDSGLEWIGEIPSVWKFGKMKYQLSNNDGGVWGSDVENENDGTVVIRSTEITIDGQWDLSNPMKRLLTDLEIEKTLLYSGDIVLTKSSGSPNHIGKSVIVNSEVENLKCCYSNFVQRLRFRNYNPKLYHYILNNHVVREQYRFLTQTTTGLGNLNGTTLNEVFLPFIPLSEQQQIVSFLDTKTSLIDSLIEKTQQKIKLLKEKRISIINELVTTGLNPNVGMRDSGVEWIGNIPIGWDFVKLKQLFYINKRISGELGYDVLSVTQRGLKVKDLENNKGQHSMDYSKYQFVYENDFVMNHMDLITGYVDLSKQLGVTSPDYRVFTKSSEKVHNQYYLYIFQMCYIRKIFYGLGRGVSNLGRWRLPSIEFLNMYLPFPSLSEQQQIVEYLDEQTQLIDKTISIEEKRIELLKEYRQSLISEVVTGKRKVV